MYIPTLYLVPRRVECRRRGGGREGEEGGRERQGGGHVDRDSEKGGEREGKGLVGGGWGRVDHNFSCFLIEFCDTVHRL